MEQKSKRHVKKGQKKIAIIRLILVLVLIASLIYLAVYFLKPKDDENTNNIDDMENIEDLPEVDTTTEDISKIDSKFVEKVKELQQENSDVKGWIKIDGTGVNYPMVQTTDNNYYVRRNYKKESSRYGSIFINYKSDIKDVNSNVIIYGHDMKNDSQMFGDLIKYIDKNFYNEHPIITIATDEEESEYEIISVFKSRIFYEGEEDNEFVYYHCFDFNNKEEYNYYVSNSKAIALYDTGKTAKYGEQIITLITCEYSQENGRLVVVAKKIS